jgi:hypothetical protein
MIPQPYITKTLDPNCIYADQLQKGLESILHVLTAKRTKRAQPNNTKSTSDKIAGTILIQMLAHCSDEVASDMLGMIGEMIYLFANELSKTDNVFETLHDFLVKNNADKGNSLFTIAPSTLDANINSISTQDIDAALSNQINSIQGQLRKQGLWSKEVAIIIDPTDTFYRGKYRNQCYTFGIVGQKSTYKRAFKEVTVFTNPAQLMVGSKMARVIPENFKDRDLPLWIGLTQARIADLADQGTATKVILGDREYYSSLGMAFSYFGLWLPDKSPQASPRMVVPKKIWDDSVENKWEFLLDDSKPIIQREMMGLDHYQRKFLGDAVNRLPFSGNGTKQEVPVASVAAFDVYGNGHRIESLDWGRKQAKQIESHIQKAESELKLLEETYRKYIEKLGTKEFNLPKYKGKRRRIFKDPIEGFHYHESCNCFDKLQTWKNKKQELAKRLMFFRVSLRENEATLPSLVQQYHERWGIENCFKDLKYKFLIHTNSRKPTARHVRFILSSMVYNAWHFRRLTRIANILKKSKPGWKPFDCDLLPKRRKFEAEYPRILTAQGFLIEELGKSLQIQIEKIFTLKK